MPRRDPNPPLQYSIQRSLVCRLALGHICTSFLDFLFYLPIIQNQENDLFGICYIIREETGTSLSHTLDTRYSCASHRC